MPPVSPMPVSPMHVGYLMLLRKAICKKQKYFVRRLKNNQNFQILEDSQGCLVAEESVLDIRVIAFCDVDNKTEYRLATNLAASGDCGITMKKSERDIEKHGQENCCKNLSKAPNLDILINNN